MSLLCSDEILKSIYSELQSARNSVRIASAYCKKNALEKLISHISCSVSKRQLLVRFRLQDILQGSTDFEIMEYCMDSGWEVFIRFDLHAKTYIIDDARGIIGSSNATNSGLNIYGAGNFEIAAFIPLEKNDISKIDKMFEESICVTPELLAVLKNQFENASLGMPNTSLSSWSPDILNLFHPSITVLFSHELPELKSLPSIKGERVSFLEYNFSGDTCDLKERFRWSNAYLWLKNVLLRNNRCMYFGQLSSELHNVLVSDPRPYRKDVKT